MTSPVQTARRKLRSAIDYPWLTPEFKLGNYGAAHLLLAPKELYRRPRQLKDYVWGNLVNEYGDYINQVVQDRVEKTGKDPQQVSQNMQDKILRITQKQTSTDYEKYKGAMDGNLDRAIKFFEEGRHGLDWYDGVYAHLQQYFGEDTDLFLAFVAATSPQQTPNTNLKEALLAWQQYVSGLPMTGWAGTTSMNPNMMRVIRGDPLRGPKVYNFLKALKGDPTAVVIDRWMVRALLGLDAGEGTQTSINNGDYFIIQQLTREVAGRINKNPIDVGLPDIVNYAQIQAGIWTGVSDAQFGSGDGRGQKRQIGDLQRIVENFDPILAQIMSRNPAFWEEYLGDVESGKAPGSNQDRRDSYLNKWDPQLQPDVIAPDTGEDIPF